MNPLQLKNIQWRIQRKNHLVKMGYLSLLLLLIFFLSSLSLLLLLLLLVLSSLISSLSLFLLLFYLRFCFVCTSFSIFQLRKSYNKVPQKLDNSNIVTFFVEDIVLKSSNLKYLKICNESNKKQISFLSVRVHDQRNHCIVDKHSLV